MGLTQMDITVDELKHLVSDRALQGETMLLNMGPQHPSTHGVLRLLLELDGEVVVNCIPDIGFLHTGIEKNMESKTYTQAIVMTDRMDYLNTMGNVLVYVLAIEKLVDLDVPPRAQVVRVILTELQRIASHLVWLGTHALDLAAMSVFLYCFRERELILDVLEMCSGQRMMTSYFRPGGLWRDVPPEFEPAVRSILEVMPGRIDQYEDLLTKNPLWIDRTRRIGVISGPEALRAGLTGPSLRGSGSHGICARRSRTAAMSSTSSMSRWDPRATSTTGTCAAWKKCGSRCASSSRRWRLPSGPVLSSNRKFVPPPRSELGESMEALIHHFKLWTEGFSAPAGLRLCGGRVAARRARLLPGGRRRPEAASGPLPHAELRQPPGASAAGPRPPGGRPGRDHRQPRHRAGGRGPLGRRPSRR